jgi:hypothetical protein
MLQVLALTLCLLSTISAIELNKDVLIDIGFSEKRTNIELVKRDIDSIEPGTFTGFTALEELEITENPLKQFSRLPLAN